MCVREKETGCRESDTQMPCSLSYISYSTGAAQPRLRTDRTCVGVLSPCVITRTLREQVDKSLPTRVPPEVLHSISQPCPPIVIYDNHQDQMAAWSLNHAGAALRSSEASVELLTCLDRLSSRSNSLFFSLCKSLI